MEQAQPGPWQSLRQTFETVSVCADTNLKILRQLTDFSAHIAKESISLGAALQASTLEAYHVGQSYVLQRLSALPDVLQNPMHYYQGSVHAFVASAEQGGTLLQGNTPAVLGAMEQYWITVLQTSNNIQASYAQLADQLKSLYTSA
jgi:hypothetical protein